MVNIYLELSYRFPVVKAINGIVSVSIFQLFDVIIFDPEIQENLLLRVLLC